MDPVIGVNVPGGTSLGSLGSALKRIADDGWQAAELNLGSCPLILGGKVCHEVVSYVKSVLSEYPLKYTAHGCYGLDLRNIEEADMHRNVLLSSIEVCQMLGIDRINLHYEEKSDDPAREARFIRLMREAAEAGAERGVMVNIENIEVERCHYALEAVKEIAHPNCAMTLDLGHLWLSANYFGYDFMAAVKECAPYLGHLHINDNHGIFEPMRLSNLYLYNTLDKGYRFEFSRGDIHIPPLWGNAPIKEALGVIKKAGYNGIWLCEYYSHLFHPLNPSVREKVLEAIREA